MSSGDESTFEMVVEDDLEIIQEGEVEQPIEIIENEDGNANNADDDGEDKKKVVKPKKVIKNPQPKLNEETLKGPRGLSGIEKHFERVAFKGRGYEEHDLNILMKTYEYWCHRLFPKFPFDSCLERLEKLGTKRATQVYVKRIRMGIVDEEKVLNSDDEVEDAQLLTDGFSDAVNDPFDQLVSSNQTQTQRELNEDQLEQVRRNKEKAEKLRQERLKRIQEKSSHLLEPSSSSVLHSSPGSSQDHGDSNLDSQSLNLIYGESNDLLSNRLLELNEEQIEQIRRNKEKAEKLRQERLKQNQEKNHKLIESPILQDNQVDTSYDDTHTSVSNGNHYQTLENEIIEKSTKKSHDGDDDDNAEVDFDHLLGAVNANDKNLDLNTDNSLQTSSDRDQENMLIAE